MISPPANAAPARPAMGQSGWTGRSRKSRSPRPQVIRLKDLHHFLSFLQGRPPPRLRARRRWIADRSTQKQWRDSWPPTGRKGGHQWGLSMAANGEIPMAAVIKPARAVRRHRTWARGRLPGRSRRAAVPRAARASDRPRTTGSSATATGSSRVRGRRHGRIDQLRCGLNPDLRMPITPVWHLAAWFRQPIRGFSAWPCQRPIRALRRVTLSRPVNAPPEARATCRSSIAGTRVPLAHPRPGVSTQFPWGDPRSIGATCG